MLEKYKALFGDHCTRYSPTKSGPKGRISFVSTDKDHY